MPTFITDQTELHYQTRGDGEPLILSFCLGGNLGMWGREIDTLAAHYRVIVWDPRGHGDSESPADPDQYGVVRSAHDLRALIDHLGYQQAVVGGVSMGAGIAACFAGEFPERARAVLIIDSNTAAGLPVSAEVAAIRTRTIELCEAGDMDAVAEFFLANSPAYRLFAAKSPANEARLHDMIKSINPIGFANTLRSMLVAETTTQDLRRITSPTLVLAGDKDPAMKAIELTASTIAHSVFEKIQDAGHLSNIDQPDLFAQSILRFLDSLAATANS